MEFAAITETLLIDAGGVYDPGDANDRILLGLKGTMGEVELHMIARRAPFLACWTISRPNGRTPASMSRIIAMGSQNRHRTFANGRHAERSQSSY
jgi:hypothetical protein